MELTDFRVLDLSIARARIGLSLIALLLLYLDPAYGGFFTIGATALTALGIHFAYGVTVYTLLSRRSEVPWLAEISTALDIIFATIIAILTEGPTSPAHIFFVFAIVAVGFRSGFKATLAATVASVSLYLVVIAASFRGVPNLYIMRAGYLAIAGYLIGFFGRQRARFEVRVRDLESRAERHTIARSLHDGYVQALAGMNLRLQTCRELLQRDRPADALVELSELQNGVAREYDEVRSYIRTLIDSGVPITQIKATDSRDTRFRLSASFAASGPVVEQIIQIMLEGMRNTLRHGNAHTATIDIREVGEVIRIAIDDDGVGFAESQSPPWAITSRVAEFGGRLRIARDDRTGAHLEIEMPTARP
jgi:signal transduction histidine kinase